MNILEPLESIVQRLKKWPKMIKKSRLGIQGQPNSVEKWGKDILEINFVGITVGYKNMSVRWHFHDKSHLANILS